MEISPFENADQFSIGCRRSNGCFLGDSLPIIVKEIGCMSL